MIPLLFLLSSLHSIEACIPTPSVPMPMPPPCSALCAASLLPVVPPMMNVPAMAGPCAVRTLLCIKASPLPPAPPLISTITYNGGAGSISAPGVAVLTVTCNGAGTAWTYMGIPITSAICT